MSSDTLVAHLDTNSNASRQLLALDSSPKGVPTLISLTFSCQGTEFEVGYFGRQIGKLSLLDLVNDDIRPIIFSRVTVNDEGRKMGFHSLHHELCM